MRIEKSPYSRLAQPERSLKLFLKLKERSVTVSVDFILDCCCLINMIHVHALAHKENIKGSSQGGRLSV
jgi:hypothetical protein